MSLSQGETTPVGFEPTRGDPIGLAGRRLNRSAKVSYAPASTAFSESTWWRCAQARESQARAPVGSHSLHALCCACWAVSVGARQNTGTATAPQQIPGSPAMPRGLCGMEHWHLLP